MFPPVPAPAPYPTVQPAPAYSKGAAPAAWNCQCPAGPPGPPGAPGAKGKHGPTVISLSTCCSQDHQTQHEKRDQKNVEPYIIVEI